MKTVTGDLIALAQQGTFDVIAHGCNCMCQMGAGIAAANVKRKIPLTMSDANEEALSIGVSGVLEEVSYNKESKSADVERAVEFAPLINGTTSDVEIAQCDVVIEAVVENLEVKKSIFARLEPQLSETAILASNTAFM